MADIDAEREAKRKRQQKRMTKILAKAWNLPNAEYFQDSSTSSNSKCEGPQDLSAMGEILDSGGYSHGKSGWEKFAIDIGSIYNRISHRSEKHSETAKHHLQEVKSMLSKIDQHLSDLAFNSMPSDTSEHVSIPKKRKKLESKANEMHIPKKKHMKDNNRRSSREESLTFSQREDKAMEGLVKYFEECGGTQEQASNFRCKVSHSSSGDHYNVVYFSKRGQKFRSMEQAARSINLTVEKSTISSSTSMNQRGTNSSRRTFRRPRNNRELESERKKLKKELDKLMKTHVKASKVLDDFNADHRNDSFPIDDKFILEENEGSALSGSLIVMNKTDMLSFEGIPPFCTPDILMVWNFLCTFSRTLSLEPVGLSDFVASLSYKPISDPKVSPDQYSLPSCPPLYLAEAHLSLLKLLLMDPQSDQWWFSTLDTDETSNNHDYESSIPIPKRNEGDADDILPTIKVDMASLLSAEEDPVVTRRWLQALEDIRTRRANAGGPIKSAIKSAMSLTTNLYVKTYLHKAMRKWKGNSAGFTKRSVVWLIGRVREARPDLWGRKVSEEAVAEQKKKVAQETSLLMAQLDDEPDIGNVDDINFGDSDDESDSDEGENSDEGEDEYETDCKTREQLNDSRDEETTPVTSSIPLKPAPTLVDLLLPPTVPKPGTDLVTPFTWPCVVGATACRILHRYKRMRNEVDDSLRESIGLNPISIAERRRREKNAAYRLLSECTSAKEETDTNQLESAIDHLCSGKNYLDLTSVQKLCILRILVEAVYDFSERIRHAVETNIKDRINAEKQLDLEERRAKREAKVESSKAESAARERLHQEAKESFILKKRRELTRNNKYTKEFSEDHLRNLTDDDIVNFDEETKTEFDSLPLPQNYSKSEVNIMVKKILEEEAFGTNALVVLTLEEINSREENELASMEDELSSYGNIDTIYEHANRETSAKIDNLKKEIINFKEWLLTLPQSRTDAINEMKEAIDDGTIKALKAAIKSSKLALLTGDDEESGGIWALDLMRDCALELKAAEKRKRVTDAQKDLVAKRNKCFIRTVPIGRDRYNHKFWQFDYDKDGSIWIEADFQINSNSFGDDVNNDLVTGLSLDIKDAMIGATDKEEDFICPELLEKKEELDRFLAFSRQEYHKCGQFGAIVKRYFACLSNDDSIRALIKNLDSRGVNEGSLKTALKEMLESCGISSQPYDKENKSIKNENEVENLSNKPEENLDVNSQNDKNKSSNNLMRSGDEEFFKGLDNLTSKISNEFESTESISIIQTAIGERIQLKNVVDPTSEHEMDFFEMGTVVGWKWRENTQEVTELDQTTEKKNPDKIPVWCVETDEGGEIFVSKTDLMDGIRRAHTEKEKIAHIETYSSLLSYRNKMGRFCGRAADAPQSSTPIFFARMMLKREQEYYTPLKNRCYDNNWGGKSGSRNAWIASMKEHGHDLSANRDGLLTLENAFFEFCQKSMDLQDTENEDSHDFDARVSLSNKKYRFDIELESIVNGAKGLWNSKESRAIFREIMSKTTTIGFLALGLDLLCRNCQAYLDATKPTFTRNSYDNLVDGRTTRNSQVSSREGRVTRSSGDKSSIRTRRMNSWQQSHY